MMRFLERLFRKPPMAGPTEWELQVGFAALAKAALEDGEPERGIVFVCRRSRIRNVPVGDWEFTARRIRHPAQGIEAGTDETRSGSAEGESPAPKGCAKGEPA